VNIKALLSLNHLSQIVELIIIGLIKYDKRKKGPPKQAVKTGGNGRI